MNSNQTREILCFGSLNRLFELSCLNPRQHLIGPELHGPALLVTFGPRWIEVQQPLLGQTSQVGCSNKMESQMVFLWFFFIISCSHTTLGVLPYDLATRTAWPSKRRPVDAEIRIHPWKRPFMSGHEIFVAWVEVVQEFVLGEKGVYNRSTKQSNPKFICGYY